MFYKRILYDRWLSAVEIALKGKLITTVKWLMLSRIFQMGIYNWHYTANIDLAFISVEHHLVLAESNACMSYSFKTISKPLNFNGLRDYFSALNMIWYSPCLLEIVG